MELGGTWREKGYRYLMEEKEEKYIEYSGKATEENLMQMGTKDR